MWTKNQFQLEPGTYRHKGTLVPVVVTELVTHEFKDSEMVELIEPRVVYRDLVPEVKLYVTYSMLLTMFKEKFERI
jgi:hypothetical protein